MALAESSHAWSETRGETEILVVFEGIDQDAQDALDVENFARGVQAPSREDPGGKAFAPTTGMRRGAMTPGEILRLSLTLLFVLITWGTLSELDVPDGLIALFSFIALLFGAALPMVINMLRAQKAAPIARSVNDTFTLRIGPGRFILSGVVLAETALDLRSIDHFVGDQRLSIALVDGTTRVLPCRLRSRAHAPLAARLNQIADEVRTASSGYRGPL